MEKDNYSNYLIYEDGSIWSKPRSNGNCNGKYMFSHPQNPSQIGQGRYLMVGLHNDQGSCNCLYIHRLIAELYIPNPENKKNVYHINRNRTDNRLENLKWATCSEIKDNRGQLAMYSTNSTGFQWIAYNGSRKCPNHSQSYRFTRGKCKRKGSSSIPKLLCYSFFYLLKFPYED
tara:strand:- start:39 stop:560 length:522 start_codon:yes stop_codon:yes gene_type:complete